VTDGEWAFAPCPAGSEFPQRIAAAGVSGVRAAPASCGVSSDVRSTGGSPPAAPLGQIGALEVRLAKAPTEIREAQRLRYRVFYREMSAQPDAAAVFSRRDQDAFDAICEHLLVVDRAPRAGARPQVVGTYRLLRQDIAERHHGFYSAGEFEVDALVALHRGEKFLEVGRSCVSSSYRHKRTIELLWHGVWTYVLRHRIDVMIGCASLPGNDPDRLALPLSFLHHYALAPEPWRTRALPHIYVEMNRMPKAAVDIHIASRELPPLIRGYLRLGAFIGDGAVIDHRFGTTDVLVILPIAAIRSRYLEHFGSSAERHSAVPYDRVNS
jgi:putative hemolysin